MLSLVSGRSSLAVVEVAKKNIHCSPRRNRQSGKAQGLALYHNYSQISEAAPNVNITGNQFASNSYESMAIFEDTIRHEITIHVDSK